MVRVSLLFACLPGSSQIPGIPSTAAPQATQPAVPADTLHRQTPRGTVFNFLKYITVQEIGLRSLIVRAREGTQMSFPNGMLAQIGIENVPQTEISAVDNSRAQL